MQQDIRTMLSDKMIEISNGTTAKEKADACTILGISRPTLDKYLSGDTVKIDIAEMILDHFSKIIKKRLNSIQSKVTA